MRETMGILSKSIVIAMSPVMVCAPITSVAVEQTPDHRPHLQRMQHASERHRRRTKTNSRDAQLLSLITQLRAQGVTAKRGRAVSQPFFSVKGQAILINGESVQIFVYPSTQVAESDASRVSPSGTSVGTSMVSWVAPPHFYRKDNLIGLYVGKTAMITQALEGALGPQFAGG